MRSAGTTMAIVATVLLCGCAASEDLSLRPRGLTVQEADTFCLYLASDVPGLLTNVRAGSKDKRDRASRLLALMGAGCVVSVGQLAEDNDWEVRREAARILGNSGAREGVSTLLKLLSDENWAVRSAAAEALGGVPIDLDGEKEHARRTSEVRPDREGRDNVKTCAEGTFAALQKACKDEMWPVRLAAVRALARIQTERVVPILIEATFDKNDEVALQAVNGLASSRDKCGLAVFEDILLGGWKEPRKSQKRQGYNPPLTSRAAKSALTAGKLAVLGLERLATKKAVRVLERACTSVPSETGLSWRVRGLAAAALERLSAAGLRVELDRLVPIFEELLCKSVSADIAARADAETLLAECGAGAAQPVLDALLQARDEEVTLRLLRVLCRTLAGRERSGQRVTAASALGLLCLRLLSFPPACQEFIIDWSADEIGVDFSFRTLALAARSADANVRSKAIDYLSQIPVPTGPSQGCDPVGDLLLELLLDPFTMAPAVQAVTRRPLPCYREALERMFCEACRPSGEYLHILNALASLKYDGFSQFLLDAWTAEQDDSMRGYLLFHLAQSNDPRAHAVVIGILHDSNAKRVSLLQYALELIEKQKLAAPTDVLADMARNSDDNRVRALALRAYASSREQPSTGNAAQFLASFLNDANCDVRTEALRALSRRPDVDMKTLGSHVREALNSGLTVLQHTAIEILASRMNEQALEWLLSFAEDSNALADTRALVLLELPKVRRPPPVTRLIAERLADLLSTEKAERMRSAVLLALGLLGDRAALPEAVTACADPAPYVRVSALQAVAAMRGEPMSETIAFLPALLTAARDEDANVRAAAVDALASRRKLFVPATMRAEGPEAARARATVHDTFAVMIQALGDPDSRVSSAAAQALGALEEPRLAPLVAAATRQRMTDWSEELVMYNNAVGYYSTGFAEVAMHEYANVLHTLPDESRLDELAHEALASFEAGRATKAGFEAAAIHLREAARLAHSRSDSIHQLHSAEERRFCERLYGAIASILAEKRPADIAAARGEIRALSRDAENAEDRRTLLFTMVWCLTHARVCLGTALEIARHLLQMDGREARVLFELGWVHYSRSEHEEAEMYLREAQEAGGRGPLIRLRYAATLAALGKRTEALGELNAALDADPGLWQEAIRIREFQPVGEDREFAEIIGR
jgi:HEAT repeat protein